jgi:hypothetical protein
MTLSVVVAIGLGMLGLLSSYSSIGRQEAVQSLNKDSLVLRSMLGADYVYFPDWRIPEEAGYGVARFWKRRIRENHYLPHNSLSEWLARL